MKQYQKEAKKASEADMWPEYLERDFDATKSCLEDMIDIAKRDLTIYKLR